MGKTARITVTSGPDRGKVFQLNEELVHVGSGSENQIALTDQTVSEHQASIVSRDDRYAIYTPLEDSVQIDGNVIPAERWVWLPTSALIVVSKRTSLKFDELPADTPSPPAANTAAGETNAPQVAAKRAGKSKRTSGKRRKVSDQPVARFITDKQGDTLVKLGEDGHLPELQLVEGETRKTVEASKKQSNPIIIYAVLAFSMCASLLMVVVDFEPPAATQEQRDKARQLIVRFYGINKGNLEPYQALLREARLARSRGDFATERRNFAQVLTKLNAEDTAQSFSGLTGDRGDPEKLPDDDDEFLREFDQKLLPSSDQVLRHLISILLRR
jgi:hypothetical protein